MKRYVLDIETNGLYDGVTTCHCIVLRDLEDNSIKVYNSNKDNIKEGLIALGEADEIIGHNILNYDLPVLKKLYRTFKTTAKLTDTLVLARLIFPHISDLDYSMFKYKLPEKKLIGSQSLKAWGYRLGESKGSFGESTDWSYWTQEMEDYCIQDVNVTTRLYNFLTQRSPSKMSEDIELRFAELMTKQELYGFKFDLDSAKILMSDLTIELEELKLNLQQIFPPKIIHFHLLDFRRKCKESLGIHIKV